MSDLSLSELHAQARKQGFLLVSISKLDSDRELFADCATREDVKAVLGGLPPGSEIDLWTIPASEELEHRRQVKEELLRRGIDPTKPVRASLVPIPPRTGEISFVGKVVIAKDVTLPDADVARQIPLFDQAGKEIGWADGISTLDDGRTICDLHFHEGVNPIS